MRDKALKKSILAVVATVVLLALVGGLLIVFQLRMGRLLTEMTIQNIAETQELYAESLHTALHNQVQMLQAQTAYFYDADLSNIDEIKDKAMSGIELGDFKKIAVVNLDGVAVDLKGKTLPNMKNKSYFINALLENKVQYSDQIELDSNLEPCLVITYPFSTFRGEKGVIAGFFSYEALKQIFSIPIFSGLSYFYLVSSRGNILLFNKDKSKNIYNIDVFEYINNVSETENPELAKMKMDMIKNRPGNITLDGVEGKKLFLYAPLKINGWYIISALPFSYIHGQQTRIDMLVYMLLAAVTIAIVVFILIITVITKQVQAIKKDNKRLIIATNQAQTLIFEYDVQNQKVDFSGDTHFILGTDKNSFDISFIRGEYGSRVHPDDRQVFAHLTQALKNKDTSFSAEFRFKSFSDEYFWVKMTGSCILDADGNTKQFIGSITNVNSQVLHEQELRNIADHDRLSNLLQNYESTERLSGRSSDITDEMLTKIRGDLRQQIASLTTQIADAQRNEKSMKSLYDDGLVTERVYFSARDELLTLQRQKQEAEQRLIDNELNRVKSTGETDQKLLSLQHQIDEARTQLEIQQEAYQSATCIISSVTGTVYEVAISRGAYVAPGSTIAVIEPYKSDGTALQATVFFPAQEGKRIERGMNIAISPSTVKQEEYGYIQGIVMSVSEFPVSTQYLLTSLQNEGLAKMFAELGTPIEVKVSLIPDPTTATGFRWSSSKGPNISLATGILCTGAVTVRKQKPVELIIPLIKKKLLGIGNSQDQKEQGGKSNENKQHR